MTGKSSFIRRAFLTIFQVIVISTYLKKCTFCMHNDKIYSPTTSSAVDSIVRSVVIPIYVISNAYGTNYEFTVDAV